MYRMYTHISSVYQPIVHHVQYVHMYTVLQDNIVMYVHIVSLNLYTTYRSPVHTVHVHIVDMYECTRVSTYIPVAVCWKLLYCTSRSKEDNKEGIQISVC